MQFKGKKVAVLGYGIEGQSLTKWLLEQGADVTVCDKNISLTIDDQRIKTRLGEIYLTNLEDFEIVFRSPGIPFLHQSIQKLKEKGIEISSATKLFFQLNPAKIIGVTGTKGKGTTALLIYQILKESGQDVHLAGNIGQPMMNILSKLKPSDWVVLELSSFQLQDLDKSPHIAVVLDLKEDHLDYHQNFEEYKDAKKNIINWQTKNDFAIFCADCHHLNDYIKKTKSKIYYFSRHHETEEGCFVDNGKIILKNNLKIIEIIEIKDIKLIGPHNLENICAAAQASYLTGAPAGKIAQAIKNFSAIPHRLEKIGQKNNITFFDDSASTNPSTTIAAINSFAQPLILILGGSDKKADFSPLALKIIQNSVKAVILIGEQSQKIKTAILKEKKGESPQIYSNFPDFKQAVLKAYEIAQTGDIILLSPACASFDMFKSATDRGNQFKKIITEIINQKTIISQSPR